MTAHSIQTLAMAAADAAAPDLRDAAVPEPVHGAEIVVPLTRALQDVRARVETNRPAIRIAASLTA